MKKVNPRSRRNILKALGISFGLGLTPWSCIGEKTVNKKSNWKCALTLDRQRRQISGSTETLAAAIRRGADLRIYTEFRHNEHVDTKSTSRELVKEVADFSIFFSIFIGSSIITIK